MRNVTFVVIQIALLSTPQDSYGQYDSGQDGVVERYRSETPSTTTDGGRVQTGNGTFIYLEGRESGTSSPHTSPSLNPHSDRDSQGNVGVGVEF